MTKKFKKKPTFQMVIKIGNFPQISRYYASAVEFFTREGAIAAGEEWLRKEGIEVVQKYIHTRHVHRGPKLTPKIPKRFDKLSEGQDYWMHEKRTRKQLGVLDTY
mgnify:CR=1 FL=1